MHLHCQGTFYIHESYGFSATVLQCLDEMVSFVDSYLFVFIESDY